MSDLSELRAIAEEGNRMIEELRTKSASKEDLADVVRADEVKRIQDDFAASLQKEQEARTALEAKLTEIETAANRPGNGGGTAVLSDEQKAFAAYLRKGEESSLLEQKAMSTSTETDGGFAVQDTLREGIQKRQRRDSPLRSVANVVSGVTGRYDVLVERGDSSIQWNSETAAPSDTATPTIDRISITLHDLAAMPKVTQRMLDMADFDVEAWLAERIGERFGRAEGAAFVAGDGINRPKGFTAYSTAATADASRAAETLQHRKSGANGAFAATAPADPLIKLFYDLQGPYQANATWVMDSATAGETAALKNGDGTYLLQGLMNGDGVFVRQIMGRPLLLAEDMPSLATGSLSIAVGDFNAGYTIVENSVMRVLRDPFTSAPFVKFYTTKRVGGGVTDFDAIKFLKFSS